MKRTLFLLFPLALSLPGRADEALGTLTVKGKTTILREVAAAEQADPKDSSERWLVTVHIRGAMEAMGYGGGMQVPTAWYAGGQPSDLGNNYYKLTISSPPQTFWLNPGVPTGQRSFRYDYTATLLVDGGAIATFSTSGQDGLQWANYDGTGPITFAGVTTTPNPYDGQFAQLDVMTAIPQ